MWSSLEIQAIKVKVYTFSPNIIFAFPYPLRKHLPSKNAEKPHGPQLKGRCCGSLLPLNVFATDSPTSPPVMPALTAERCRMQSLREL